MGNYKTLGGDRLGSGNRMKQELHNYFRSNHNLSCSRITSAAPGVLYPLYTNIGLTGDTFDIDLQAFVRTLPTEGPMFGSFKLQVDVFSADFRLYQAILHNNTTEIGMDMDQVYLPKIQLFGDVKWELDETTGKYKWKEQVNKSSLMYYLGMAGLGRLPQNSEGQITRKVNAIPMLAYYDIFKNYYANKQEANAYTITDQNDEYEEITPDVQKIYIQSNNGTMREVENFNDFAYDYSEDRQIIIMGENLVARKKYVDNKIYNEPLVFLMYGGDQSPAQHLNFSVGNEKVLYFEYDGKSDMTGIDLYIDTKTDLTLVATNSEVKLRSFPLDAIDNMRKDLLTQWQLGQETVIEPGGEVGDYMPYSSNYTNDSPMNGLVVKCYQSDMFNNWLDSDWVARVSEYSKVNVVNGSFSMDQLNLAKKMYNHYNRVAISGGTYDDWQLAAYGEENYGKCEKPVYHGGLSSEVVFDEVISSVQTLAEDGSVQPLGSLGGRGTLKQRKGGHVIIKCKEACVIMVMVSLTPRVTYSQGNAWYLTELDSMDDLHKPEFDRIGFQDLMGERMAWWSANKNQAQGISDTSYGKQPAWIHYQTDVDKCYADFAQEDGKGYMVLQRLYDYDQNTKLIADVTTYIDPSKYNYPFAVNSLTAQNFWLFLNLDIKARRKMSAKQIPNF